MGYVVKFHNCFFISSPKEVFTFSHPREENVSPFDIGNQRYCELELEAEADSMCHGLAGYFDCLLYRPKFAVGKECGSEKESGESNARGCEPVTISTDPCTETEGMCSWFPIYFPIPKPIYLKQGSKVKIGFWRKEDKHKVWYEWCLHSLDNTFSTGIVNPGGRTYYITK